MITLHLEYGSVTPSFSFWHSVEHLHGAGLQRRRACRLWTYSRRLSRAQRGVGAKWPRMSDLLAKKKGSRTYGEEGPVGVWPCSRRLSRAWRGVGVKWRRTSRAASTSLSRSASSPSPSASGASVKRSGAGVGDEGPGLRRVPVDGEEREWWVRPFALHPAGRWLDAGRRGLHRTNPKWNRWTRGAHDPPTVPPSLTAS